MNKNKIEEELDKLVIILSDIHTANMFRNKEKLIDSKIDEGLNIVSDLRTNLVFEEYDVKDN